MTVDRVKFQDIVESQVPLYVSEEFPLLPEFLKQYYVSQEFQSGTYDLIQNLDQYVKLDEIFNLSTDTVLRYALNYSDTTIETSYEGNFTEGFPDNHGLIKIDDEIIYYESKTEKSFINCVRGFSGISSYISDDNPEQLVFDDTKANSHVIKSRIQNLSVVFLQEFFKKIKKQIAPGFEDRNLNEKLNQKSFISNLNSFYGTKGTDESFRILFNALYGQKAKVIRPSDFLLRPSDADWRITEDMVVEQLSGNPLDLINNTLIQESTGAKAAITKVQPIGYDKGQFYQIGIDLGYDRDIELTGTKYSNFKLNSKTKVLNTVGAGSSIIDVDSTVGFAATGYLRSTDTNGDPIEVNYTAKSVNQFLGVEGLVSTLAEKVDIREDDYAYAEVGIGTSSIVRVRIAGSLNKFIEDDVTDLIEEGDTIFVKSLGIEQQDKRSSGWFANLKTTMDVESFNVVDQKERIYEVNTYDDQYYYPGVKLIIYNNAGLVVNGTITRISGQKSFIVRTDRKIFDFELGTLYKIESQTLKTNTRTYPKLRDFITNVQNVYSKFNGDTLVTSNSIPSLLGKSVNPNNRKFTFSGTSLDVYDLKLTDNDDHGFYTGDAVFYQYGFKEVEVITPDRVSITTREYNGFDGVEELVYYVKRVDQEKIRLARSKSDLFVEEYIELLGEVENNSIIAYDFYSKELRAQPIVRQILPPDTKSGNYETQPNFYNGIFLDGVEILNYKSSDKMYYGSVVAIDVENGGEQFDVINPPLVHIEDTSKIGFGATGTASVEGVLQEIRIIDNGFDYRNDPTVSISGGNGQNAAAEVNTKKIRYSIPFNAGVSTGPTGGVDLSNNVIGFSTFHKFADNERIVYKAGNQQEIGGLKNEASYYVSVVNGYEIKLHKTFDDADNGTNVIDLTSAGYGIQNITAVKRKKIISSIVVTNPGSGYKNKKKKVFKNDGVNVGTDTIYIAGHGYKTGEIVNYYRIDGEKFIVGINTNTDYYVYRVDDDNFRLSEINSDSNDKTYFLDRKIFVNLRSIGAGFFNYKPIVVSIDGIVGVSTLADQDFGCKVQPIFRGSIDSVDMILNGQQYGSDEIINFQRSPLVRFRSGENAVLTPIINNQGKVVDVVINEGGSQYFSAPDLVVNGSATNNPALLTPITTNGVITDVIIAYSGSGYTRNQTSIEVVPAGKNYSVTAKLNEWSVNRFAKELINVDSSDTFVSKTLNGQELQVSHIYPPRELRESVNSLNGDGTKNFGRNDLVKRRGVERTNNRHSPILGWAYDGNPIYGPYAFKNGKNGIISQMRSGYVLKDVKKDSIHRPSRSLYPGGFFLEDYYFSNNGDLDVHNGRFCITPDYPNGTYAYFTTFTNKVASGGAFKNFKIPAFPYVVGNTFKYRPNFFNLSERSTQELYDLESNGWFRNTQAYHLNDDNSDYNYVIDSNAFEKQSLEVTKASKGNVQNIGIVTGGRNYQVGDRLRFNNRNTSGRNAQARVSRVSGQRVVDVRTEVVTIPNVEFSNVINPNTFVGFAGAPHNLKNSDTVVIDGLSSYYKGFDGYKLIGVSSERFALSSDVDTPLATGIVTYFPVYGLLEYPSVRPNDILDIEDEKVKVINVDKTSSRLRVIRSQMSTSGTAHTATTTLLQDSRKLVVQVPGITTSRLLRVNEEYYFIPDEVVGVGTNPALGVGSTVTINDPGAGPSSRFLLNKTIYIPNHGIQLNDRLYYNRYTNSSIQFWNGVNGSSYQNLSDYDFVYAAPITKDTIGLSTEKVGVGSTGGYVGVNSAPGLMYFTNNGNGDYQSFLTDYKDTLKGEVSKNVVTVATAKTHGMNRLDNVVVSLKPLTTKTIEVLYLTQERRIVFNPAPFDGSDLNLTLNTITFSNHDYIKGDKVYYLSNSVVGGMANRTTYYVIPYDKDRIQLVQYAFELKEESPKIVDLSSSGNGTFYRINPMVKVQRNQTLNFDLSHPSLSFVSNGNRYSAFEMNLFSDYQYLTEYTSSAETREFEVSRRGKVGISDDAQLSLFVSDFVPQNLWYNFELVNLDRITRPYREYYLDDEVISHNQIFVEKSEYNGGYSIVGVGSTFFQYNLKKRTNSTYWTQDTAAIEYTTNSKNSYGSITDINITNPGYEYLSLPSVSSVRSKFGTGALLVPQSNNIGNILGTKYKANKIGFDYPTDQTMRVVSNVPEVVTVSTLASFTNIGIASQGRNYLLAPDLIVIDGFTNEVVPEIELKYTLGDTNVQILTNTFGLYPVTPRIVPINNSNGVGINSALYDIDNKTSQIFFSKPFRSLEDFPFQVNDEVFVENTSVGIATTGSGYNSSDYSYQYFTVIDIDPNIGGANASITCDMSDMIDDGEVAGNYDIANSIGNVVPVSHLPIYSPEFKKNDLMVGEIVDGSSGSKGTVLSFNPVIEVAKITGRYGLVEGETLTSRTSGTISIVGSILNYDSEITTTPGTKIINGWEDKLGFLNSNLQRLPNNEYYQNFSYSVASEVDYNTWDDAVSSIAHPGGLAKFADLQVVSRPENNSIVSPIANFEQRVDITSEANIWCFTDFDYVSERTSLLNGGFVSREIYFENRLLTDHFECVSNRVTMVDDFSGKFNSDTRDTPYIDIGQFSMNSRFNRMYSLVRDTTFIEEVQFNIFSFIHDNTNSYQQDYATLFTNEKMGYFEWIRNPEGWTYRFFPAKPQFNNYEIDIVSFGLFDSTQGIGTDRISDAVFNDIPVTNFLNNDIVEIETHDLVNVEEDSSNNVILSYDSSFRSAKSRVLIVDSEGFTHGAEVTTIHNGTDVGIMKFGDLKSTQVEYDYGDGGIGTFGANMNGGNVEVTFTPVAGVAASVTSSSILISGSEVGIGSTNMVNSRFMSNYVSIPASATPTSHDITSYGFPFSAASYIVVTSDTTNNQHEVIEISTVNNDLIEDFATFGGARTGEYLGTFDVTTDTSNTIVTYTPIPNIDVEVRVYGVEIQFFLGNNYPDQVDTDFLSIVNSNIIYKGTQLEQQNQFEMNKDNLGIFIRNFRGDLSEIVGLGTNSVTIPYHLYETGDRILYNGNEGRAGTSVNRIGIAETTVAGVSTDKLPRDLYAVKVSDAKLAFAETPADALLLEPKTFQLTSLGIGTFHQIKSQKTDERTMIVIDNVIQSPVADSDITTQLTNTIATDTEIRVVGITSFFSDDIIRIDDEYMLVIASWFDEEDSQFYIEVVRGMLGSALVTHQLGSQVVKVSGQYNIVENDIVFIQSPKGNNPMSTTTDGPDEFDWTGVTTHSSFQGRVFNRTSFSGQGITTENYDKNHVFDDISSQFTGIRSDFLLKYEGNSTVGIYEDNAWVMINGVLQHPDGVARNGRDEFPSYNMQEAGGETTIQFMADPYNGENNTQTYPRGGILLEIGSKPGFGYQPLVSAGGTSTISDGELPDGSAVDTVTYTDPSQSLAGIAIIDADNILAVSNNEKTVYKLTLTSTGKPSDGFSGITSVSLDSFNFVGCDLVNNGTTLLVMRGGTNQDQIGVSTLSTPYDITTGTDFHYVERVFNNISAGLGLTHYRAQDLTTSPDGHFLFIPQGSGTAPLDCGVIQLYTPVAFDYDQYDVYDPRTYILKTTDLQNDYPHQSVRCCLWAAQGHVLLMSTVTTGNVFYYTCSKAYDLRTATFDDRVTTGILFNNAVGCGYDDETQLIMTIRNTREMRASTWQPKGGIRQISIGSSGSGYRSGLQTVRVGVQTYSAGIPNISNIGIATVVDGHVTGVAITNPAYNISEPYNVVFDAPLPYDDIPLIYSSDSPAGVGTGAKVDIVVGNGSSVINFELVDTGAGYGDRGILTVDIGGTTGIPTTGIGTFSEFQIEVGRTQRDIFNAWYMGELEVFDSISDEFDGRTKTFNLKIDGEGIAVVSRKGSQINIPDVLIVLVNGVLQEPGRAYDMQGGSVIRFSEAPKEGDRGEIFFYKGTRDKDVIFKDIIETVKEGDTLNITNNPQLRQSFGLNQDDRVVTGINTLDSVATTPYVSPGVTTDTTLLRPVTWCRQLTDVIIDGEKIGKDRQKYEPNIFPFSYVIQNIGVTTDVVYVDNLRPLFDADVETEDSEYQDRIQIFSQSENETAEVTATVNESGNIVRFNIVNPGMGYTSNPYISVADPKDGSRAFVDSIIQNQQIVRLEIAEGGTGYDPDNPPIVMVEPPRYAIEEIDVLSYDGDYGRVVGFQTVTSINDETQMMFDFYIPTDSYMRQGSIVPNPRSISGIQTGDYFTVFDSNISHSKGVVVSLENDNRTRIAISTDFANNVYQAFHAETVSVNVPGVGSTSVRRVFTNIAGFSIDGTSFDSTTIKFDSTLFTMDDQEFETFSGSRQSAYSFGNFSWGKIIADGRPNAQEFSFYGDRGYAGISSSAYVRRFNDLKYKNYEVFPYDEP